VERSGDVRPASLNSSSSTSIRSTGHEHGVDVAFRSQPLHQLLHQQRDFDRRGRRVDDLAGGAVGDVVLDRAVGGRPAASATDALHEPLEDLADQPFDDRHERRRCSRPSLPASSTSGRLRRCATRASQSIGPGTCVPRTPEFQGEVMSKSRQREIGVEAERAASPAAKADPVHKLQLHLCESRSDSWRCRGDGYRRRGSQCAAQGRCEWRDLTAGHVSFSRIESTAAFVRTKTVQRNHGRGSDVRRARTRRRALHQ